jgi:ribonuclease VapC
MPLLDELLAVLGVRVHPVNEAQLRIALEARIVHGRGFGSAAGLNFGDRLAYALAKPLGAPLLFIGDDTTRNDLEPALG